MIQTNRYYSFFLESSCIVLLYDSLRHPTKHFHNKRYIQAAIECLRAMIDDEPIVDAVTSLSRILRAVEETVFMKSNPSENYCAASTSATMYLPTDMVHTKPASPVVTFAENPSATSENLIRYSDSNPYQPSDIVLEPEMLTSAASDVPLDMSWHYNFDVFATDLSSFFPLDTRI